MHGFRVLVCVAGLLAAGPIQPLAQTPSARFAFDAYQPGVTPVAPLTLDELWTGARDFKRQATAWFNRTVAPTDLPRRRLLIATYALELLEPVESKSFWTATQPASSLLDWAWEVLRLTPPAPAERAWWIGAMALLERSAPPDVIRHHLERADTRFPNEDRWLLIQAIVDEREAEHGRRDDGSLSIGRGLAERARRNYQAAAARAPIRAEALIRHGAFESDLGQHETALRLLDEAGTPDSAVLRFWLHMWKGRARQRAVRLDAAAAAYRVALNEFPASQAAAFGYAEALVETRRMLAAAEVIRKAASRVAAPVSDPWDFFRMPEVLWWPATIEQLRLAVAR